MSEFGGFESFTPGEAAAGASEGLSENAKERFAQAQQQIKQIGREEKKARKRDDRVAKTIRQFLEDDRYAHLFQLISRLASMDTPSVFILALLSLIHEGSLETVEEYIVENNIVIEKSDISAVTKKGTGKLPPEIQENLFLWTTRLELVIGIDTEKILSRLMPDEGNIDGSVLQLTNFVLVDFFRTMNKNVSYEDMQPLTMKILQDIIAPHVETMEKYFAKQRKEQGGETSEE